MNFLTVLIGEMRKQRRNYLNSPATFLSLFIWPVMIIFTTYYLYKPFDITALSRFGIDNEGSLLIFLITGSLGYYCFWSQVEGALHMTRERESGVLEITFLSPASRMAILYGRSLGYLVQNMWLFGIFSVFTLLIVQGISLTSILLLPVGFIVLCLCATIWGGFINSLFLITRDTDVLFILFDRPMHFLSGTEIPVIAFPRILQFFSSFFPLTYCLILIRALFDNDINSISSGVVLPLILASVVLIVLTFIISRIAEKTNRKTGGLQFY